jgi:L-aminopeptidase/D-esterase-like protein
MGAITGVAGIKVGNAQNLLGLTGITVVLCEEGATASVQVFGGSPGTRETDLLRSSFTVDTVHAVFLAGGSAFGLNAAEGVVRYLEERKVGFDAGIAKVPIVPGAVIFDLGVGNPLSRPTPEMAYRACTEASGEPPRSGNVGAGAGATVGKMAGPGSMMKSGLGNSSVKTSGGHTVGAIAVVNALGDVYDPATGLIVAGAYDRKSRRFVADMKRQVGGGGQVAGAGASSGSGSGARSGEVSGSGASPPDPSPHLGTDTTIGVVATDCALSKEECERVALMAMGGLAQTVRPSFTPFDGDTIFVLSTGREGPGSGNRGGSSGSHAGPDRPSGSGGSGGSSWLSSSGGAGSADGSSTHGAGTQPVVPPGTIWTGRGLRAQLVAEIGIAAQEAVVLAVLDAVRSASGIPGIPAARDLSSAGGPGILGCG